MMATFQETTNLFVTRECSEVRTKIEHRLRLLRRMCRVNGED